MDMRAEFVTVGDADEVPDGEAKAFDVSGAEIGMLFVDAANRAAVGLYESLGFATVRVDRAYERARR